MSRKPANKIAERAHWHNKMKARKKLDAELELIRLFDKKLDRNISK